MAYGLPNVSYLGYPFSVPGPPHAGLGVREAAPGDADAVTSHFQSLGSQDLRLRFCGTVGDDALQQHVAGLWSADRMVLVALDGPLWSGPLGAAGPIRSLAEFAIDGPVAELGISVDPALRRRGIGTYLIQTGARLLGPRRVDRIRAYTLAENQGFTALVARLGGRVTIVDGEVEAEFDVDGLAAAYRRRRAAQVLGPVARALIPPGRWRYMPGMEACRPPVTSIPR